MATSDKRIQIGLVQGDAGLLDACQGALRDLGRMTLIKDVTRPEPLVLLDLVLLAMQDPIEDSIRLFARYRASNPQLPVILLASGMGADLAVELVKCGAADYLSLPADFVALRRKIERVFLRHAGPTFDAPMFAPLLTAPPSPPVEERADPQQRRRCFRARVPAQHPASVTLDLGRGNVQLNIADLSVPVDDVPGGMRLRLDPAAAARLPDVSWECGKELSLTVHLSTTPTPIPVRAKLVRVSRAMPQEESGVVWLGVQYEPLDSRHADRFQRYWILCQRLP